jgi:hypothetical protein
MVMNAALVVLALFPAGFAAGYGVREIVSRRRRARERQRYWAARQI